MTFRLSGVQKNSRVGISAGILRDKTMDDRLMKIAIEIIKYLRKRMLERVYKTLGISIIYGQMSFPPSLHWRRLFIQFVF